MEREGGKPSALAVFQQLKRKMSKLIDPMVQAEGLTPLQCCALIEISQGGVSVGALCEQIPISQANASTLCKKLEQAGYLVRARSARDERVVTLSLTERGRETLGRIQKRMRECEAAFNDMPEQVRTDVLRGLEAADLALDYLSEQIKGEQNPC